MHIAAAGASDRQVQGIFRDRAVADHGYRGSGHGSGVLLGPCNRWRSVLRRSVNNLEREPPVAERCHGQATGHERSVRLIMAAPAEGDEAIEVEVGSAA